MAMRPSNPSYDYCQEAGRLSVKPLSLISGCAPQSMVPSNKAEIDVKKHHVKRFQVIDEFLGKAACPSKRPPGTAPQPAVVPFYSHRIPLSRKMPLPFERGYKTLPSF
jgi:hypothetical protein